MPARLPRPRDEERLALLAWRVCQRHACRTAREPRRPGRVRGLQFVSLRRVQPQQRAAGQPDGRDARRSASSFVSSSATHPPRQSSTRSVCSSPRCACDRMSLPRATDAQRRLCVSDAHLDGGVRAADRHSQLRVRRGRAARAARAHRRRVLRADRRTLHAAAAARARPRRAVWRHGAHAARRADWRDASCPPAAAKRAPPDGSAAPRKPHGVDVPIIVRSSSSAPRVDPFTGGVSAAAGDAVVWVGPVDEPFDDELSDDGDEEDETLE